MYRSICYIWHSDNIRYACKTFLDTPKMCHTHSETLEIAGKTHSSVQCRYYKAVNLGRNESKIAGCSYSRVDLSETTGSLIETIQTNSRWKRQRVLGTLTRVTAQVEATFGYNTSYCCNLEHILQFLGIVVELKFYFYLHGMHALKS